MGGEFFSVQVEDVKNPHSEPSTASTTNSTFNYGRDILGVFDQPIDGRFPAVFLKEVLRKVLHVLGHRVRQLQALGPFCSEGALAMFRV